MPEKSMEFREEIASLPGDLVLDIGARDGELAEYLRSRGKRVITIDIREIDHPDHVQGNFLDAETVCALIYHIQMCKYDIIVASHVFEHVMNKGVFLHHVFEVISRNGKFVCIVPPMKPQIVGGHVNLFNMGLLMYNLILGGFDCKNGSFMKRGYNIAAIVGIDRTPLPELAHDCGDIELLADRFPWHVSHGFNGDIEGSFNWNF